MKFRIGTASGRYYEVDDNGRITRLDLPNFKPSGHWTCIGFREVLPFGRLGRLISAKELIARSKNGWTTFKNGNPRFRLCDNDHGTHRIWGDGIRSIWEV